MASPGTELASLDFGNLIGGPLVAVINAQSIAANATTKFIKEVGFYPSDQPDAADGTKLAGTPVYVDFKYPKEVQPYQPQILPQVVSALVDVAGVGYGANQVLNVVFAATDGTAIVEARGTLTADAEGAIPIGTRVVISSPGSYTEGATVTATVDEAPTDGATATIGTVTLSGKIPAVPAVYQEMKISVAMLTIVPIPFIKVERCTIDFNAKINSMETTASSSDFSANATLGASYGGKRANVSFTGSAAYKKTSSSGSSVERTFSMAISVSAVQDDMPPGMEKLLNILEGAMISTPGAILPTTS